MEGVRKQEIGEKSLKEEREWSKEETRCIHMEGYTLYVWWGRSMLLWLSHRHVIMSVRPISSAHGRSRREAHGTFICR
jgi:hypothetical protein